ncbi:MAG: efflux RND transporter permease subunit [Muribaculaceae bacterium]|nr:efflux RND transporter permease subunit [Muribaculaceae bacterium]
MLNKIISISLRNRLAVLIVTALILVAGTVTLMKMEVDIFPDLNAPTVVLMTEAPGFAAEEVEQVVSYPIETAMNGTTGVRRVRSSSTAGFSVVWVEFDWDTDIYLARQIVAEQLDAAMEELPAGVSAPVMGPQSSILGEMMIIGLRSDSCSTAELRRVAERTLRPRLLALGGVSQVSVIGGDAPEYQIKMHPDRMQAYGVSVADVLAATEGVNSNAGGGVVYDYGNEYIVKADLNTTDTDELGMTVVRSDAGGSVTLADIATIEAGGRLPRIGVASVEAEPAVLLTVTKQPRAGTRELSEKIDRTLEALRGSLPAGTRVSTDIFRQSDFIDSAIGNLQSSLAEGAFFVILVLFIFLMNVRTTIISVIALPLSIIVSVIILNAMGQTINTMSLGGIAIAIGCLVDDAIVDVENVYKRLRENRSLPAGERRSTLDVVFHASAEVRMPIFNSTLIIAAAFAPLFFLQGMEGRMLIPLGIAFLVSLAASTIVALTVTPVLCSLMLARGSDDAKLSREPRLTRAIKSAYSRSLVWAQSHAKVMLAGTAVLFAVAAGVFCTLGSGFLPPFNEGSFTINVSTLPGISLEESDRIGREAERIILDTPEVLTVARKTGRAELDEHSLGVNVSEIEAPYRLDGRSRHEVSADIRRRLSHIPGVVIEIGQPISHRIDAMLSGAQSQIAVKIFGPDLNMLFDLGRRVKEVAEGVEGAVDVNIEQQVERPQLIIKPRRELLAQYGVTPGDFGTTIATALGGRKVGEVYEDGFAYDLSVVLDEEHRASIADVGLLPVNTRTGIVPLEDIADISVSSGPNTVNREGVERRLIVSANVEGRDLVGTVDELRRHVADTVDLPEGYHIVYGGQFENSRAASRTLLLTSAGALLLIFMLLYGEFGSAVQSAVILVNMPLAMIGGVLMLAAAGGELNIPAIIGFISLMGISTRNGMLLISRYNALADEGEALDKRIAHGSADRLLPIIMTALTSAFALIPLALKAQAPGNEIQAPMALVILGGLISSTALNIYLVPILYRMSCRRKGDKR